MLKIKKLIKSYKSFPVLLELNMNVQKGDVYGFLGTNGCGKTTTMNIICNIIPKDSGEVVFEDENVKIGYLPESPALYNYMNGFEYLNFIGACSEYEGDIKERTAEVLKITGMAESAHRLIGGYSRGMNQRIGIAAALYPKPDLLILDEPTSALDPAGRAEVMEIIEKLSKSGATIILCTHILGDVERVANKIGIMHKGVLAVEGDLSAVKNYYSAGGSLTVRLQNSLIDDSLRNVALTALSELDIVETCETMHYGDFHVYSKRDVKEAELFYKVATTLAGNQIVPEGIWFNRISLEQIYLGINSGQLQPMGSILTAPGRVAAF